MKWGTPPGMPTVTKAKLTKRGKKTPRSRTAAIVDAPNAQSDHFMGGKAYQRPRWQFQALYMLVGTLKGANSLADDLILWPNVQNQDGSPHRPNDEVKISWCEAVDDGKEMPPEAILKAVKQRFESFTETNIRLAINENAKASRKLAGMIVGGEELTDNDRKSLTTVNNGTGFMYGNTFNKRMPVEEKPKKIGQIKVSKAKPKQLPEGTVAGEYRVIEGG